MSTYGPNLEEIFEPVIAKFIEELENTKLFDEVDEGENTYEGVGTKAMVVMGTDTIRSVGMQKLQHTVIIYVLIFTTEVGVSPKDLRKAMSPAYDALLADITHGGTCWKALPRKWDPGLLQYGGQTYVGIAGEWEIVNFQSYPAPTS